MAKSASWPHGLTHWACSSSWGEGGVEPATDNYLLVGGSTSEDPLTGLSGELEPLGPEDDGTQTFSEAVSSSQFGSAVLTMELVMK